MTAIYALTILLAFYAFGDCIAMKTKGLLSSVFVICVVMLVSFWVGLPKDIAVISGISTIGGALVGPLVVGIGTTISFDELKRQWKTVIASAFGVTVGVVGVILIGNQLIGWNEAVASAPVFAGAAVSLLVVNQALTDLGLLETIGVIVITIYATQKFFGVPLASFCLQREAKSFLGKTEKISYYANLLEEKGNHIEKKRPLAYFSKSDKPVYNLVKLALIASLANFLSELTNGAIHNLVIALVLGVVFTELGFLKKNSLAKTDSNFLIMFATIMTVFASLANVTPKSLVNNLLPVVIVMVIGTLGVIVAGFISGKVLKESPWVCIALGITCTFGFPTTVLMSNEIAESMGRNEEEMKALRNYILPKMTVDGFVTVTIGSVILAGIIVPLLK